MNVTTDKGVEKYHKTIPDGDKVKNCHNSHIVSGPLTQGGPPKPNPNPNPGKGEEKRGEKDLLKLFRAPRGFGDFQGGPQ